MSENHVYGVNINDLLEGTLGLSLEGCGLYFKLMCVMAREGGRVAWEEREIMAACGVRDPRTLARVMEELTSGRRPKLALIRDADGLPWLYGRRILSALKKLVVAVEDWGVSASALAPLGYDAAQIQRALRRRAGRLKRRGAGGGGSPQAGDKPASTGREVADNRASGGHQVATSRPLRLDETLENQRLGLDPLFNEQRTNSSPHPPMAMVVPLATVQHLDPMAGDGADGMPRMRLGELVGGTDTACPRSTGPFAPGVVAIEGCRSWRDVEGLWARSGRWIGIGTPPGTEGYLGPNATRH